MKMIENLISFFSRPKSYGIGVLDDHVEKPRGGFSQAILEERRQAARSQVSIPVWYRVSSGLAQWLLGKSVDHSEAGIRLALPPGVTPGTEIDLRMKLPDSTAPVNVRGVVVWVEPVSEGKHKRSTVECGVAFKN